MRKIALATVASTLLLGAAAAQAGDPKDKQDQFKAADQDRDGSLTLTEAQTSMPKLAADFAAVDTNGDSKVSQDELDAYTKSHKSMEADETTTPPK